METRVPPHSREAEQAVLGSILIDKESIWKISNFLLSFDFFYPQHQTIYQALLDLANQYEPIDLVTLASLLEDRGKMDAIGGHSYLMELTSSTPTATHIVKYARIVKEKAVRRLMISYAGLSIEEAHSEDVPIREVVERIEVRAMETERQWSVGFAQEGDNFDTGIEKVANRRDPGFRGFKTGFFPLDETLGLKRGHLWLGYAKSAVGKTTFAMQIARNVLKAGGNVRFLSLEMDSSEIWSKLFEFEEAEGKDFGQAADVVKNYPGKLVVEDNILSLQEIRRYIKTHKDSTDVFMLDFLSLPESPEGRKLGEIETIIHNARAVQKMAQANKACVLALAQANTDDPRVKAEPWKENIKGGNSVKQVATVMFKMTRSIVDEGGPFERPIIDIYLQKNKFGRVGQHAEYEVSQIHGGVAKIRGKE